MSDNIRRVVKAICAVIACAGVLIVVLSLCLLVFGSKAEGVYKDTLSVNGSRYTYLYTYTADGAEYEYTMTRRFPRGEGEHSTQKISYLGFAPSVAYTGGMTGLGMIVAAAGGLGFFAAAGDKNRPRPAAGKSPQWNSYLNKVKSGNKQE